MFWLVIFFINRNGDLLLLSKYKTCLSVEGRTNKRLTWCCCPALSGDLLSRSCSPLSWSRACCSPPVGFSASYWRSWPSGCPPHFGSSRTLCERSEPWDQREGLVWSLGVVNTENSPLIVIKVGLYPLLVCVRHFDCLYWTEMSRIELGPGESLTEA